MVAVREPTHVAARAVWELGEVNTHALCIWELLSFGEGRKGEMRRDLIRLKKLGAQSFQVSMDGLRSWAKSGQVLLISI